MKNQYPFPLIDKSLDQLGRTKHLTQLILTNAYYWIHIRKGDK